MAIPIYPVEEAILALSVPAVIKIMSEVELAVKVLAEDIRVVLADWIVKVEAEPVVCQVEAAAPVRFKLLVAVMLLVSITMVLPIVVVAAARVPPKIVLPEP